MHRQGGRMNKANESKKQTQSGCFTIITKPYIHSVTRDTYRSYVEHNSTGRTRRSLLLQTLAFLETVCKARFLIVNRRDFTYKNSVRTSQETHYVSATKTNRLMLFGEIIAVYCENHTEHINTLCRRMQRLFIQEFSPYLTGNTLHLRYRDQPVNAVWGNSRYLL
jgi:hypothetical protein